MKIKYCLPIIAGSKKEVVDLIDDNQDYDFYEVWLDYVVDIDVDFVGYLLNRQKGKNFIFLFRRVNFEKTEMPDEIKTKIIKSLENNSEYLDLDINDQISELEFIEKNKLNNKKIISYHNYEETPDEEDLIKIINFMNKFSPVVVKIATKCKNDKDALRLMTLIHILKEKSLDFIVTGMGPSGRIVRVYGMLNGNFVNFAPNDVKKLTADGQILKKDLQLIADIFDNK